jgi:hypothetical protein
MLRWVHTCNVHAFRNAATLQVTHTIRSYDLNFHPVPHGVTVSCKRYTRRFPVCYGCPNDVFAASSGLVHLYTLHFNEKKKDRWWWQRQPYANREVYSVSNVLADLNRGLVLSIMNLRLSYANHKLLYASSFAVKKSKVSISKLISYSRVIT